MKIFWILSVGAFVIKKSNTGKTTVIFGDDGGHNEVHNSLWEQLEK